MDNDDESERHEAAQRAERDRLDKLRSPLCETPGHQRRVAKISDIEGMRLAQKGVSFPLSTCVTLSHPMHVDMNTCMDHRAGSIDLFLAWITLLLTR